jgi:hypothetical protein
MEKGGVAITLLQPINTRSLSRHDLLTLKEVTQLPLDLPFLLDRLIRHSLPSEEKKLLL